MAGSSSVVSPTIKLCKVFPPTVNQHGDTVLPVILMLVAHELQNGTALPPEVGAMCGDGITSETKLARSLAKRLPPKSIACADSGFGIFSVAWRNCWKKRIPQRRTEKTWDPSMKDWKTNSDLPADVSVDMMKKELLTSMAACNVVIPFLRKNGRPTTMLVKSRRKTNGPTAPVTATNARLTHDERRSTKFMKLENQKQEQKANQSDDEKPK